jgi:hypothetical protein
VQALVPLAASLLAASVARFVASSCALSNPALKADWPDAAQAII